jgi:hypothetical protein
VIKLDNAGNVLWSKTYGGGSCGRAIFDPRDSTIVGVGLCGDAYQFQGNHGSLDMFMFKVDRNGTFKWAKQYGDKNYDEGMVVSIGPNKGYYLGGTSLFAYQSQYNHIGGQDAWIFLTDSVGNPIVQKIYGSASTDENICAILPVKGGVLSIGWTNAYDFTEGSGHNYLNPDTTQRNSAAYLSLVQQWKSEVPSVSSRRPLEVFPNPAHNYITVLIPNHGTGSIRVVDGVGRITYLQQVSGSEEQLRINTGSWQPGAYTVCWEAADCGERHCATAVVK